VLDYKGKTEKLIHYDSEEKNERSLIEDNNTLPLKKFILKNILIVKVTKTQILYLWKVARKVWDQ